jgi:hypothetical protein
VTCFSIITSPTASVRSAWRGSARFGATVLVAALVLAGLLLPEQPELQEQWCLRYSSPEACRVW